jgi:hypothetical protein
MSEVMWGSVCKRRGSPIGCCLLSLSYKKSRLGLTDRLLDTFPPKQKRNSRHSSRLTKYEEDVLVQYIRKLS